MFSIRIAHFRYGNLFTNVMSNVKRQMRNVTEMETLSFSSEKFGGLDLHKCHRCPFLCLSVDDMKCHSTSVHSKAPFTAADALLSCPACPDRFFTVDFFQSHLHYHHRATPADARLLLALFVDELRRKTPSEAASDRPPEASEVNGDASLNVRDQTPDGDEKKKATSKTSYSKTGRPNGARSSGISKYRNASDDNFVARNFGYKCSIRDCGVRLNLPESVEYHEACHVGGTKELRCRECERRFVNLETLHNHLWKEHRIDVELHKCDRCPYRAYSLNRLNNIHKKIHSDEKNYECDACSMAFKNSKQLANHRNRHKKKEGVLKKYPCDVCKLELSTPRHLETHKRNVHDKVKLFDCNQCQYSSYTKSSLLLHVRSHTGTTQVSRLAIMTRDL